MNEFSKLGPEDFDDNTRGLLCIVHRAAGAKVDYTRGGVTGVSGYIMLVGHGIDGPTTIGEKLESCGLLVLRRMTTANGPVFVAVPRDAPDDVTSRYVFGCNFIFTSDARFPTAYAVPVYDCSIVGEILWVRIGDQGDYIRCESLEEVAQLMTALQVKGVLTRHSLYSVESDDYRGHMNYISLYWGDEKMNPSRGVRDEEIGEINRRRGL
jgi:hypothetical protein